MEDMMRLDGILDHLLSFHWNVTLMLDIQCQALLNRMGLQKGGITHCQIWEGACCLIPPYQNFYGVKPISSYHVTIYQGYHSTTIIHIKVFLCLYLLFLTIVKSFKTILQYKILLYQKKNLRWQTRINMFVVYTSLTFQLWFFFPFHLSFTRCLEIKKVVNILVLS